MYAFSEFFFIFPVGTYRIIGTDKIFTVINAALKTGYRSFGLYLLYCLRDLFIFKTTCGL